MAGPITAKHFFVLAIVLLIIEGAVFLGLSILAGLGHCNSVFDCLVPEFFLSLVVILVCPIVGLAMVAYYRSSIPADEASGVSCREGRRARRAKAVVALGVVALLFLTIVAVGQTGFWYPPVPHAVFYEYKGFAKRLVEMGADVNAKDRAGRSALHYAAASGDEEMLVFLLDKGADVNITDGYGWTPLFHVGWSGGSFKRPQVLDLLVRRGADLNAKDLFGRTILHLYTESGNSDAVGLLVNLGADVNSQDSAGATPLLYAARAGRGELVRFLLEQGANPAAKDKNGDTPLTAASRAGHSEIVTLFEQSGAK